MNLREKIKDFFRGEILDDEATLRRYSRDASLFEIAPKTVVRPVDVEDLKKLVKFVSAEKDNDSAISLTARSGGTDMSGGALSDSVIVDFSAHFTKIIKVGDDFVETQPGVPYRDLEKETLKNDLFLPSYPASREMCTIGGMISNNSGGEKTLRYGKTDKYVKELRVVLGDGEDHVLRPIRAEELENKIAEDSFEGKIYEKVFELVRDNKELLKNAKPRVSKNSAGYALWDIWDGEVFDLTKLFTGAQGTLGFITTSKISLVKRQRSAGMAVIFMKDLKNLADIVHTVLPFQPSSFESFDDHTFKLAIKFMPEFFSLLGAKNSFSMALSFLPEVIMLITKGAPKMALIAEFEGPDENELKKKIKEVKKALQKFPVSVRVTTDLRERQKYWAIRRESYNLLRNKIKDKQTAPFIDDLVVVPESLADFLPRLYGILDRYNFLYTIAGHVGNGNFHIIPLMHLSDESERKKIPESLREVYKLVLEFGGSITGEHNDGLIRSPFLENMYGKEVCALFEKVKDIFDPKGIFNPGKKVHSSLDYALAHIKRG